MKRLTMITAITVIVVGGYFGGRALYLKAATSRTLNVKPYVLERIDYGMDNGKEVVAARHVIARRSDGGTVTIGYMSMGEGKQPFVLRKIELPTGFVAMISDALGVKSSGVLPGEIVARNNSTAEQNLSTCATEPYIIDGEETLLGHRAVRLMYSDPNGLSKSTLWKLPDLNCATVQIKAYQRKSSSEDFALRGGSRLAALALQEPDAKLFDTGAHYKEMKPSDQIRAAGVDPATCPKCFAGSEKQDKNYEAWQPK